MGRSDFSWRNVFSQSVNLTSLADTILSNRFSSVFGSRTTGEQASESPPPTPIKSGTNQLRTSRSFLIFRSPPRRPSREFKDDTSSFLSPMPRELRSRSFDGSDLLSPSSSDESEDWDDSGDADSATLSFIDCSGILKFFPEPPILTPSKTPLSRRRRALGRLPIPAAFLRTANSDSSKKRTLKQIQDRSPTPFTHSIRHGPLQYSTTTIPFDLLSRTHQATRSTSSRSSPKIVKNPSRISSSSSSRSLQSSSYHPFPSPSLARSRSCNLLSRSCTPEPYLMTSRLTSPMSRRLSASVSLQDLRSTSASPKFLRSTAAASPPPSSFRLATAHVPGLEYRLSGSSRGSDILESSNSSGSHVPFGTLRF